MRVMGEGEWRGVDGRSQLTGVANQMDERWPASRTSKRGDTRGRVTMNVGGRRGRVGACESERASLARINYASKRLDASSQARRSCAEQGSMRTLPGVFLALFILLLLLEKTLLQFNGSMAQLVNPQREFFSRSQASAN
ncbi:hypothetical protein C8R46DRAFT_1186855 [Mycena filopes]|nr:hypothetical protein C8R46DRAFT_1186855 [Mycena filopes]